MQKVNKKVTVDLQKLDLDLCPERHPDESYSDYRKRRILNFWTLKYKFQMGRQCKRAYGTSEIFRPGDMNPRTNIIMMQ